MFVLRTFLYAKAGVNATLIYSLSHERRPKGIMRGQYSVCNKTKPLKCM